MPYRFPEQKINIGRESAETGTIKKQRAPDTPVGLGSESTSPVASYGAADLKRLAKHNAPARDAARNGYTLPDYRPGAPIQFVTRLVVADKPAAPSPGPKEAAGARNEALESPAEIIRPFASGQPEIVAAITGLRTRVEQIMERHGVRPSPQPESSQRLNGVAILDGAVVMNAARRSGAVRAALSEGKLAEHIVETQPPTYAQAVTAQGAELDFFGPKGSDLSNRVVLRAKSTELNKEAAAGARSLAHLSKQKVAELGPVIEIATTAGLIPNGAAQEIREAAWVSHLREAPITFDPSPALQQARPQT